MTAIPREPGDFTEEPRESDLVVRGAPLYQEEPGARPGKPSAVTLAPCTACGVPVITGITYALLWRSGERHPRLSPGRGYPAHQCRPCKERP